MFRLPDSSLVPVHSLAGYTLEIPTTQNTHNILKVLSEKSDESVKPEAFEVSKNTDIYQTSDDSQSYEVSPFKSKQLQSDIEKSPARWKNGNTILSRRPNKNIYFVFCCFFTLDEEDEEDSFLFSSVFDFALGFKYS